jgi:hypothetical protein
MFGNYKPVYTTLNFGTRIILSVLGLGTGTSFIRVVPKSESSVNGAVRDASTSKVHHTALSYTTLHCTASRRTELHETAAKLAELRTLKKEIINWNSGNLNHTYFTYTGLLNPF